MAQQVRYPWGQIIQPPQIEQIGNAYVLSLWLDIGRPNNARKFERKIEELTEVGRFLEEFANAPEKAVIDWFNYSPPHSLSLPDLNLELQGLI